MVLPVFAIQGNIRFTKNIENDHNKITEGNGITMAFLQCGFRSQILDLDMGMNIFLPQDHAAWKSMARNGSGKPRVLYLLHGLTDDQTGWQRKTSIERYIEGRDLAVVMPTVHRSFYSNTKTGYPYMDFMALELPKLVSTFFNVSDKREDTFIAGLSMGGYGAFKLALTYPEQYSLAASLSGAVNIASVRGNLDNQNIPDMMYHDIVNAFGAGGAKKDSADDLMYLARKLSQSASPKPKLMQFCGTEDFLYEDNIIFRDTVRPMGFDYTYSDGEGGHTWSYWDARIQDVLNVIWES